MSPRNVLVESTAAGVITCLSKVAVNYVRAGSTWHLHLCVKMALFCTMARRPPGKERRSCVSLRNKTAPLSRSPS